MPGLVHLSRQNNTEREIGDPEVCPERYRHLAEELARRLSNAEDPPLIVVPQMFTCEVENLVVTTSGYPVVLRSVSKNDAEASKSEVAIALALPKEVNLSAWFRAFLADILRDRSEKSSAGTAPPRKSNGLVHPTRESIGKTDRGNLRRSQVS